MKLGKVQSGVAGEYFVAAELSRRGFIASITLRNTKSIDIIASNKEATETVSIQVKTNQGKEKEWMLSKSSEDIDEERYFYVFVNLNGTEGLPEYHIVPSTILAKQVKDEYREWISGMRRDGKPRTETSMRTFRDRNNKYKDRWDLLKL